MFRLMALWSGGRRRQLRQLDVEHQHLLPKRLQGTALGLNAGIRNFGVTTTDRHSAGDDDQPVRCVPAMMVLQRQRLDLRQDARAHRPGSRTPDLPGMPLLVPLSIRLLVGMNNLKTGVPIPATHVAFAKITYLYTLAFVPSIAILYLYLPKPTGSRSAEHGWPILLDISLLHC